MRIGCEERARLHADDVAWVIEWQLASAFCWVPISSDSPVFPESEPDHSARTWDVLVRAGEGLARIHIPLRDLARVIVWCRHATRYEHLLRPPAPVRASLQSIRFALRAGLGQLDPLRTMGYSAPKGSTGEH